MRSLARAAATLAAVLAVAPDAAAKPWRPPPAAEMEPAPRPATFEPDGVVRGRRPERAGAGEPPVHFVAQLGGDYGLTTVLEIPMADGSTSEVRGNQGGNVSVGAAFLKLAGGRLATQATIGVEYFVLDAANGSIRWLAFPLEVMEFAYVNPLRLGVGVSYLLSPSIEGDGAAALLDIPIKNSPGLVMQADWVWPLPRSARGARVTTGARFVVQRLEPKDGDLPSQSANAIGFVLGVTL